MQRCAVCGAADGNATLWLLESLDDRKRQTGPIINITRLLSSGRWSLAQPSLLGSKILGEGTHGGRRGIEADVMLVRGKRHQYPFVGKNGIPLQAFLGSGRSFANTLTHFPKLFLSFLGRGMYVF